MELEGATNISRVCTELWTFVYRNDEKYEKELQELLKNFNGLDFSKRLCDEQLVSQIVNRLCYLVPPSNEKLLVDFSLLVYNLLSRQEIVLVSQLDTTIDYLLKALNSCPPAACNAVLRALGAVLYENAPHLSKHEAALVGGAGLLRHVITSGSEELLRSAVQCVENMCMRVANQQYLSVDCQSHCMSLFLHVLQRTTPGKLDEVAHCKVAVSALRGLQHLLVASRSCPADQLGAVLAVLRTYMLYGMPEAPAHTSTAPLRPSPLGPTSPSAPPSTANKPSRQVTDRPGDSGSLRPENVSLRPGAGMKHGSEKKADEGSGGGSKKGRKKRGSKGKQDKGKTEGPTSQSTSLPNEQFSQMHINPQSPANRNASTVPPGASPMHSGTSPMHPRSTAMHQGSTIDPLSLYPAWSKASSSDSDFSETEGTGSNKARAFSVKVRQSALGCFHALVRASERRTMFGYWSSFLPIAPGHGTASTLFTAIMKDPSAKARTGALAVLTALFEGSKQYLQAAEDSEQYRTAPFTPFSVTLGYMIKEVHRCLNLALTCEQSPLAITQIIKCMATIIPCVPYHRLKPGLLTRVMKQTKPFISHRDPNIRVACLSCLGAMVTVQAPMLEVNYILQATRSNTRTSESNPPSFLTTSHSGQMHEATPQEIATDNQESGNHMQESGYQSTQSNLSTSAGSSDGQTADFLGSSFGAFQGQGLFAGSSGVPTPQLSSGAQTPSTSDMAFPYAAGGSGGLSWVIRLCVKNTAPQLLDKKDDQDLPSKIVAESSPARVPARTERYVQPLPVRLESLQVLTSMCKGYFLFIRRAVECLSTLESGKNLHKMHLFFSSSNQPPKQVLSMVGEVIRCCLEDSDISVQLHGAKLLDELGTVMSNKLQDGPPDTADITVQQVLDFWLALLNGPVPNALQQSSCSSVRSTLCDCLSTISAPVFDQLPTDKHILCMTLTLGLSADEDHYVRASAIRTLGVYAFIPCLRQDVSFMADAANAIIMATEEQLLAVKVKAMWSLGNLTDALATNKESDRDESFTDEFSDLLLYKLLAVATRGALDTDKVRSNAVRALGNLLRYLPQRCLQSSRFSGAVLEDGVKAVVKNVTSGPMKVRWNSCYAIGNMLRNTLLPFADMPWMSSVLTALQAAVRDCKNFKVRINAALSLSIPTDRRVYGSPHAYAQIWSALIECLHSSETTTDLAEYKYSEALNEQMLSTLVHLSGLLQGADLPPVKPLITQNLEFLSTHAEKYVAKESTAKDIEKMQQHLRELGRSCQGATGSGVIDELVSIFTRKPGPPIDDTANPEDAAQTGQPLAFRQTYE